MKLKQELYQYKFTKTQLKLKELELERVRNEYKGICIGSGDSLPSGSISKNVENEVIKKGEKEVRLIEEIKELKAFIHRIDTLLEVLDEKEKLVIEERYFNNHDLYMISDIMGYAYSTVKLYHKNAIMKLLSIY